MEAKAPGIKAKGGQERRAIKYRNCILYSRTHDNRRSHELSELGGSRRWQAFSSDPEQQAMSSLCFGLFSEHLFEKLTTRIAFDQSIYFWKTVQHTHVAHFVDMHILLTKCVHLPASHAWREPQKYHQPP
jgi:hypothetical protein